MFMLLIANQLNILCAGPHIPHIPHGIIQYIDAIRVQIKSKPQS